MKTSLHTHRGIAGNTLVVTLFVTAIIGIVLASYLTLVRSQNYSVMRSQAWNSSIPVIEAGIEDALAHLNKRGTNNLGVDGWTFANNLYSMSRTIGDSYYVVTISQGENPEIVSNGHVPMPEAFASMPSYFMAQIAGPSNGKKYVNRTVKVTTGRDGLLLKAMVAKGNINMNGNNVETDSFDSTDPNFSNSGQYTSSKRKANGDVASNSSLVNSIAIGNANIYGRVATGPNGTVSVGSNGAVGAKWWHDIGAKGIQPGYFKDDMNVNFPDVEVPFTGGAFTPVGGSVSGIGYDYVLASGNYQLSSLSMSGHEKMLVTGNAVLYVTGNVSLTGNSFIKVAPGGTLRLYVNGAITSIGGNGVINDAGYATNFFYYGRPANKSVTITGNGTFKGIIYAPSADLELKGGGSSAEDLIGATVSNTVKMNGHFKFHYDESLARFGPKGKFVITSWNEI